MEGKEGDVSLTGRTSGINLTASVGDRRASRRHHGLSAHYLSCGSSSSLPQVGLGCLLNLPWITLPHNTERISLAIHTPSRNGLRQNRAAAKVGRIWKSEIGSALFFNTTNLDIKARNVGVY